jgi:hypothetical protein
LWNNEHIVVKDSFLMSDISFLFSRNFHSFIYLNWLTRKLTVKWDAHILFKSLSAFDKFKMQKTFLFSKQLFFTHVFTLCLFFLLYSIFIAFRCWKCFFLAPLSALMSFFLNDDRKTFIHKEESECWNAGNILRCDRKALSIFDSIKFEPFHKITNS